MTNEAISWVALLTLMVDGPTPPLHGVIDNREGSDPSQRQVGWTSFANEPRPIFASTANRTTVWLDGHRIRLEDASGRPTLIVGDDRCWQFRGDDPVPVESVRAAVVYAPGNLLERRTLDAFAGKDFTRPTGPVGSTTFLGRPAYTVELAPPPHKPFPIQLVVDAETGLVLQQRNDGFGSVEEWTELNLGGTFDPGLFHWDGPSQSEQDERAEHQRAHERDLAERADWFRRHVTTEPLRVELDVAVLVHVHGDDGSFEASLGEHHFGSLARRPRSDTAWDLHWSQVDHRWNDERWDWALTTHGDPITAASLSALKRQLSPGPAR